MFICIHLFFLFCTLSARSLAWESLCSVFAWHLAQWGPDPLQHCDSSDSNSQSVEFKMAIVRALSLFSFLEALGFRYVVVRAI